ncbi:DUF6798 domain-containing protein [Microseira sp. BLCC-F43]|jgi:hypothetical protein|uniref:DUF6798 domain-containing protein n=1 Tax=Microseira sp. BLCC-F43 TaxID=3153602 RepID=UPI0035BB788F
MPDKQPAQVIIEKIKITLFRPNIFYLLTFLTLLISTFLINRYYIYYANQSLQIPLVNLLNDTSLYPNDPFVATLPNYSSKLWPLVALANRYIPLEPLFFSLLLLEKILLLYAAGNLAKTFVPNSWLAMFGTMAMFAVGVKPIFGEGTIVTNYLEQTGLAIPFFLLAISSFYKARPIAWAIWLSIGFNLNSMYGVYAITYCGAFFILDVNYRQEWKKWLAAFGLFLLLASPAILHTLSAFSRTSTNNDLWLIACQLFYPWHFYPHVWSPKGIALFAVLLFIVVALVYKNKHKLEKLFKFVTIATVVSVIWLLYAVLAAYVAKSPSMLVMHPVRGTDFWYCIAGTALVSICGIGIEENRSSQRRYIYAAAFAATIIILHPMVESYIVYIVGFFLIAVLLKPVRYFILGMEDSKYLSLAITILILLIGVTNFGRELAKTGNINDALIGRPSYVYEQLADWARLKTSKDAVFLNPPNWGDWTYFRALAKRSVFVNWNDAAAMLWHRPFVEVWAERLNALGLDITEDGLNHLKARRKLGDLYNKLEDEDVKKMQLRYSIDYWVVPLKKSSKFAMAFQNQSYKVLDLNQSN